VGKWWSPGMDADTREMLEMLLQVALLLAADEPVPSRPASAAVEQAADEYCLRLIRHGVFEPPTPEVAEALASVVRC